MKKLWMIAGSALVMSACSDNVAEMNPAPAGNNDFVTLAEISASLPATRAYLEDVEFGAGKEVKTFWSSGDCITVWSEQEPERTKRVSTVLNSMLCTTVLRAPRSRLR